MDLGFGTCGNATLIAYDSGIPILATDPWITGTQYFGSWALPYLFNDEQRDGLANVQYVWFSHGHPDHLNIESLRSFRGKTLLIPKHRGDRIASDLRIAGFKVKSLPNGEWMQLSPRVHIVSYADWNQDAAALIGLGDRCGVLNLNDGSALGTRSHLQRQLRRFRVRFVLGLVNYGDADMMNFFTEDGIRVPAAAAVRKPLGYKYNNLLKQWRGTHTAPFSCHHMFVRTDSRWAAEYETPREAHGNGFDSRLGHFIPGFFSYDVHRDSVELTPTMPAQRIFREPKEFGDDWGELLETGERDELAAYFGKFHHVRSHVGFLNFRVGGKDNVIDLEGPKGRGITFEAPRGSLMAAVRNEIFDDLLIGNFMKATLHGKLGSLYPDFTPYVAKYGDNGRAFTRKELHDYFASYRSSAPFRSWVDQLRIQGSVRMRNALSTHRNTYLLARRAYAHLKS
jgi:hypothetical protein